MRSRICCARRSCWRTASPSWWKESFEVVQHLSRRNPPGFYPVQVFWTFPAGRRPRGWPRRHWRGSISQKLWVFLQIPQGELDDLPGGNTLSKYNWTSQDQQGLFLSDSGISTLGIFAYKSKQCCLFLNLNLYHNCSFNLSGESSVCLCWGTLRRLLKWEHTVENQLPLWCCSSTFCTAAQDILTLNSWSLCSLLPSCTSSDRWFYTQGKVNYIERRIERTRACVADRLMVQSCSKWCWFKASYRGRLPRPPASTHT